MTKNTSAFLTDDVSQASTTDYNASFLRMETWSRADNVIAANNYANYKGAFSVHLSHAHFSMRRKEAK